MQEHFARMHAVGVRLAGLLSVGLGLDNSVFDDCFSEFAHVLRLLHYTAEVSVFVGRSSVMSKALKKMSTANKVEEADFTHS